ncbi:MAG: hypothetical protein ACYTFQ_00255 [Planctomycetota bacterium]|jgi:hypothetical protein
MSTEKKRDPIYRTPVGILHFPYLQVPRGFKGDTDKLYYDTQLILEGAAAAEFAAQVDGLMQEAQEKFPGSPADKAPIAPVLDKEKNVVQGKTAFKFRVPSMSKNRKTGDEWNRKPALVDANGELVEDLMENKVRIGPGTKAKIAFVAYIRQNRGAAGVTLQPVGVQVLDLVPLGGRSLEQMGFGKESGSFTGSGSQGGGTSDGEDSGDDIPF